jgi:hypothetical protein
MMTCLKNENRFSKTHPALLISRGMALLVYDRYKNVLLFIYSYPIYTVYSTPMSDNLSDGFTVPTTRYEKLFR